MAIPVGVATEVVGAVAVAVQRLLDDDLERWVRPWDVAGLRSGAAALGSVTAATVVHLDDAVVVAKLLPSGRHIALRWVDGQWRLARFVAPGETTLPAETSRRVPLAGDGPDGVLATLGIARPAGVEPHCESEDLGQGEEETRYGYRWTEGGRSVIAEEVKTEIFDGATPYSRYLRGVVVDGESGSILSGSGDSALLIEG